MKRVLLYALAFLAARAADAYPVIDLMDVNQYPTKYQPTADAQTNRDLAIRALVERKIYDLQNAQLFVQQLTDVQVIELLDAQNSDNLVHPVHGGVVNLDPIDPWHI